MVAVDQFTPVCHEFDTHAHRASAHFNAKYSEMKQSLRYYEVSSVILATKLCKKQYLQASHSLYREHYVF